MERLQLRWASLLKRYRFIEKAEAGKPDNVDCQIKYRENLDTYSSDPSS
jgi:hypothetical protein